MAYLNIFDYKKVIQLDNLQQIISQDDSIRLNSELAAIEEVKSYLIQKYDVDEEFKDTSVYSVNDSYNAGETILLQANVYNSGTTYNLNDLVSYLGNVYISSGTTTSELPTTASTWSNIGLNEVYYNSILPAERFIFGKQYEVGNQVYWKNKVYTALRTTTIIYPDDLNDGSKYWGLGLTYTVSASTLPTDTLYFAKGDARSQQMIQTVTNITLYHMHSRIAPRNIPDIRVKNYDDSIKWLKMCLMGDITPNLIKITPRSGGRIRISSYPKLITRY